MSSVSEKLRIDMIRQNIYDSFPWTSREMTFRNRLEQFSFYDFFKKNPVKFSQLNRVKLKRSIFGIFLDTFNSAQQQDYFLNENKLAIFMKQQAELDKYEQMMFSVENDFIENCVDLLEKAVDEETVIKEKFLYNNISVLRFVNTPLTIIDSGLRKYKLLKILILSNNWIVDIHGEDLPRGLQYIELFCNQITSLQNFVVKAPLNFLQIGLQRNILTNASHLHLLGDVNTFRALRSLDLSCNDIYEMDELLYELKSLPNLMSLQMEGNPCSVINVYKTSVLTFLPNLVYLDNTQILPEDKSLEYEKCRKVAAITFTCHRIVGLPQPPKEGNFMHVFYFSIELPLMVEVDAKEQESTTFAMRMRGKSSETVSKHSKDSTRTKLSQIYDAHDELAGEKKRGVRDLTFHTERFQWQKVIQLPENALIIQSPYKNLTDVRDTFRSKVNVKLIYLKIKEPVKPPQSKKPSDAKSTSTKKKRKSSNSKTSTVSDTRTQDTRESRRTSDETIADSKEDIVKKVTIANFTCSLHAINWSEKFINFYWARHPYFRTSAQEIEGNLRACSQLGGVPSHDKKDSKTAAPKLDSSDLLIIEVGIGLLRSYNQS